LPQAPHQVRAGALRGLILTSPDKTAVTLLLEGVNSDDYTLTAAAARAALETKAAGVSLALGNALSKLPADKQTLITQVLGKRGDAAAYPALFAAAKSGPKAQRVEAIKALPQIGKPAAVPVLVELLKDEEVATAALEALGGFPGKEADTAVMTLIKATSPDQKVQGIDLAGRRRMKAAIPALTLAVADTEPKVRAAALRRLGEMGGASELQGLVGVLLKTTGTQELDALEQGLVAICNAIGQPDDAAAKLVAVMGQATPAQKNTLLRVLGAVGGGKALQAVKDAVPDKDADVQTTAIRTLGEWKNADAADALLAIAKTTQKNSDKVLSLRNYLKIAGSQDVAAAQKLAMCRQAEPIIQRIEEKKMLLGVLGGAGNAEAVKMIAPYLDNDTIKEEACAAVGVAVDKLTKKGANPQPAAALSDILKKVVATTGNQALKQKLQPMIK
jgi:HEAT repeat protein